MWFRTSGDKAEKIAEQYLKKRGLKLLKRNFGCKMGEIDLIMKDRDEIAFIEVRLRNNPNFDTPQASVTHSKQRRIILAAQYFLNKKHMNNNYPCRFDVVAISDGFNKIDWIKDAFQVD